MASLHLMCGLPGAGKTTLAKQLELSLPALRLSPDEWLATLVGNGLDHHRRALVEAAQWKVAAQALRIGLDVVLENGFWTQKKRFMIRQLAAKVDARTQLHFLDCSLSELSKRIKRRNACLPTNTFRVTQKQLALWFAEFERPSRKELLKDQAPGTIDPCREHLHPSLKRCRSAAVHIVYGAGKPVTRKHALTLQRELPALGLAPQVWLASILDGRKTHTQRAAAEKLQWEIASKAIQCGVDVVMGIGTTRAERDTVEREAAALGAGLRTHRVQAADKRRS